MRFDSPESELPQPRIIPRPEHTVSRRDIELEALKVLYRLLHAGYTAFLVGGGVRDLLLGKKPKDFDVVTDARPGELRKLFRNSRIIGKRFRVVQFFFRGGHIVEVSTFRRRSEFDEVQEQDAPPAKDNTFGTPAEDAQRRDLTINALFYNIADFSLVDFVDGMEDLKAKRIRVIGDPAVRFVRDPVRMLRVLRHAARIGFSIDPDALGALEVTVRGGSKQPAVVCVPLDAQGRVLFQHRATDKFRLPGTDFEANPQTSVSNRRDPSLAHEDFCFAVLEGLRAAL